MKRALSALLIAATAGLLPAAAANATTSTVAIATITTDAAALKAAEAKLDSVLSPKAVTLAWTVEYNVAEAAVKTAQNGSNLGSGRRHPF